MQAIQNAMPEQDAVLAKAFLRAGAELGLNQAELGAVIGKSHSQISRLSTNPNPSLNPHKKAGELAIELVRLATDLHSLSGGDRQWMQHFMRSPNKVTGGIPAQQIAKVTGLNRVVNFISALRSQL